MKQMHSPLRFMTSGLLEKAGVGTLDEFLSTVKDEPAQVVAGKLYTLTGGLFVADRRTVARWLDRVRDDD